MGFHASTFFSTDTVSSSAGANAAKALKQDFAEHPLRVVIVYAGVNHDQPAILKAIRADVGPDVPIIGCSVQGLAGSGLVREGGYMLGAIGLGGTSLTVAAAVEREFQVESRAKGESLAKQLRARLGQDPSVMMILYDPLCNADVEQMLQGVTSVVNCPLIGGGAGQPFGPISRTFQYWQEEAIGHGALALGLAGPFTSDIGVCHGTSPTGIDMTVTRAEGNLLLEIDGQPAVNVWREVTGCSQDEMNNQDYMSNWALGIQRLVPTAEGELKPQYFVRASFGFKLDIGALVVQAAIPAGTRIMLHHRTAPAVMDGTAAMGREMASRLKDRRPWAVLGFECGARTSPFLGHAETLKENLALQQTIAPNVPWLGMMAWGEIAPVGGTPAFHNYTYPLLVLST